MKSSLSNIKQKCCGSCKYYAGVRDYKRGFFFGSSFEVDQKGHCLKNKGNYRDGSTIYSWRCSYYERAGDVTAYIKQEETEREAKRQQKAADSFNSKMQKEERQPWEGSRRQERELEAERRRIAKERLALERENSLINLFAPKDLYFCVIASTKSFLQESLPDSGRSRLAIRSTFLSYYPYFFSWLFSLFQTSPSSVFSLYMSASITC